MLGGIAVIGLTIALGIVFSSGSRNWPALLLINQFLLLALTYLLRNVLLLVLGIIVFFTWFGGVTGYVSGWSAYFFGMSYPVRFLFAGLAMIAFSLSHRSAVASALRLYDGFFKVWLSSGLFFTEMTLSLTSLFGNYGQLSIWNRPPTVAKLLMFNLLRICFNVAVLAAGSRYELRMLHGYAITFLIIHGYTL